VPAAAGGPGVISVGRVAVALGGMAATRSGGLSGLMGSVVPAYVVAGGMVVEVGGTVASRRGAVAGFGCAPTPCAEVTLAAGKIAAVGRTSVVLGEVAAALDTGVIMLSGVDAAGCPPVDFGVGGVVDTPAESTVGAGVAVAADDGVGAMEVESGVVVGASDDGVGAMEVESGVVAAVAVTSGWGY
jgi:hypothetical protein